MTETITFIKSTASRAILGLQLKSDYIFLFGVSTPEVKMSFPPTKCE